MKKIHILYILIQGIMIASCNDYLDKTPDNRATLNTPDAIRELLVSAYPDQTFQLFTEAMSDNVGDRGPEANIGEESIKLLNMQAYRWLDMKGEDQDTPTAYWTSCYNAIAVCNHALEAIEKNGYDSDYSYLKGEALVCRAYAHFMLVNIFAEHYDPQTASSALGIPYVNKPENVVFQDYKRDTIANVYKKIIADFNAGFPLIDDSKFKAKNWHFNQSAAAAFASRLYLYLNKPDSVIKYSSIVLGSNPQPMLRDWNGSFYTTASSPEVASIQYDKSEESANLLLIGCSSLIARAIYDRYALTDAIYNQAVTNVTGGENTFRTWSYSAPYSYIRYIPKYYEYFKRESINANFGLPYVMMPTFCADEVLLNRAEAYIMKNDSANSIKDINAYYSKRISNYDASTHYVTQSKIITYANADATILSPFYQLSAKQLPYVKLIIGMRKSEFIHEGLRWFDIKRMHLSVKHKFANGEEITLQPNDLRRAVQIPQDALSFGITPNSR